MRPGPGSSDVVRACKDLDWALFTKVIPGAPVYSGAPAREVCSRPHRLVEPGFGFPFVGPSPTARRWPNRRILCLGAAVPGWSLDYWGHPSGRGARPASWRDGPGSQVALSSRGTSCLRQTLHGLGCLDSAAHRICLEVHGGPGGTGLGWRRRQRSPRPSRSGALPKLSAGFRAPCRVGEGAMRRGRRFAG